MSSLPFELNSVDDSKVTYISAAVNHVFSLSKISVLILGMIKKS